MNIHRLLASTSVLFLLTSTFAAPSWANSENSHKQIVDEAWQVINREFVSASYNSHDWQEMRREFISKDYASKKAAYDAIRTMLMELNDPETRLLDAKQFASVQMESDGELRGVGLIDFSVDTNEKTKELRVVTAIAGTPAEQAGLRPKDIIGAIDGVATNRLSHDEAMMRMRGQAGTKVVLTVRRQGKTFDVSLLREAISVRPVRTLLKQEGSKTIGYIALRQFTPKASQEMHNAVKELLAKNVDGFVLDLRNNPGGLLKACTEIASLFLDKEIVASFRQRIGSIEEIRASGSRLTDKPVVVLVNGGTASASEVLAAALQDNRRAVLVGTTTFGRGRVHSGEKLSDNSVVIVTVGSLATPKGREIDRKGIKPDYVVEIPETMLKTWTPTNIATPQDPQYTQALAVLLQRQMDLRPKVSAPSV